ncbi:MAG: PAS domain S-box protein [Oscillatoria sp. PMC 1068.18]|nr:PAS domain S-box protein [Oscillatoria sp. PMC 1076.18]MEC4989946.1 PAS domain S-box protein [Oscillatoria sp. PMC 1068.18]
MLKFTLTRRRYYWLAIVLILTGMLFQLKPPGEELHLIPWLFGASILLAIALQRKKVNGVMQPQNHDWDRTIVKNLPQLTWIVNTDQTGKYFNQRWFDYTGLTAEQSQGDQWQQVIHPEDRRDWQSETNSEFCCRLKQIDGEYCWHLLQVVNLEAEAKLKLIAATKINGQNLPNLAAKEANSRETCSNNCVLLHQVNFPTIAAAEAVNYLAEPVVAQLAQEQFFLAELLQSAPIAIAFLDSEGRFVKVNEYFANLNKTSPEAYLGKTVGEILPSNIATIFERRCRQILATGEAILNVEETNLGAVSAREERYWLSNYFPVRCPVEEVIGIGIAITEITEYKQVARQLHEQEEKFRTLAENSPNIIARCDRQYRYLYVNSAIAPATGKSPEELIGKTNGEMGFPEELVTDWEQRLEQVFDTAKPDFWEFEFNSPEGLRYYQTQIVPEWGENREVTSVMSICRDVTESKEFELALIQSELRFRCIFESNLLAIAFWNTEGAIVEANDAFLQLIDYDRRDLETGKISWRELTPPEYHHLDEKAIVEMQAKKVCTPFEKEYLRRDGTRVPILIGAALLKESQSEGVCFILDLSETQRQKAALKKSEAQFRTSVESILDCFGIYSAIRSPEGEIIDFRVEYVNAAACQNNHLSFEAQVGRRLREILPDDRETSLFNEYCQVVETGEPLVKESLTYFDQYGLRYLKKAFDIRIVPFGDGFVATWRDITDRKETELALKQFQTRFNRLAENLPGVIYRYYQHSSDRPTGRWRYRVNRHQKDQFTYISSGCRDLFELEPQAIAANANLLWSLIHPDDLSAFEASFAAAADTGHPWRHEWRIVTSSGKTKWIIALAKATKQADGNFIWDGLLLDVTARKLSEQALSRSEAKFRRLFESNIIGVIFPDLQGKIYDANDAFLAMVGYTKTDLEAGKLHWQKMTPPEYAELDRQKVTEIATTGVCTPFEKEYFRRDGTRIAVLLAGALLESSKEKTVCFVIDLTERKQAEAEREILLAREKVAREEAEAANRVKDEFLAVLSHELRTPMNSILGWSKLLQRKQFNEATTAKALETIARNAQIQNRLIEDLLEVSRILRGKLTLNAAQVSLKLIIEAAIETVRLAAEAKSIQILTDLETGVGQIKGDPNRLQQVIWNLLSNAVKFTPEGGKIEVRLHQQQRQARIEVQDTGEGIAPEFLPFLFEYFRQENSSTTRSFGGLGLGLAIVRYLTELHGGKVTVYSAGKNQGAKFTVLLPLGEIKQEQLQLQSNKAKFASLAGVRILLVEDEADNRDLVTFILEQSGAIIEAVGSAKVALATLTSSEFDLLISDIAMPEMDGCQLIKEIRTGELAREIPAIALTGYASETERKKILGAGFQVHLSKPVPPRKLIAEIIKLLRQDR